MTHISSRQSIAFEVLTTYHVHHDIRLLMLIFGHNSPASGRYKLIALTNNFSTVDVPPEERRFLGWDDNGVTPTHLRELFDDFCDSSSLGMRFVAILGAKPNLIGKYLHDRKPEHGFYLLACERNGISPLEALFLDDIGL